MRDVEQCGFDNQPPEFVSGVEAAALLGVKRATLYAYASRGLVRSEPGTSGSARRYRREDIDRLKARHDARAGHGAVAAGALRWGEPVLESALTAIDPALGPIYRGIPAVELASRAPFEAVSEWLWGDGGAPTASRSPRWEAHGLGVGAVELAALLPEGASPLTVLALAVPALAAVEAPGEPGSSVDDRPRARALLMRMAALAGLRVGGAEPDRVQAAITSESVARALLVGLGAKPNEAAERAVDQALVLLADHELNVSTFAVRVAASAGADLHACVSAGLAALSGPKHGGVCDRLETLIAELGKPERAAAMVRTRDAIPGFGHPLYPGSGGDPRARPLLETAMKLAPRSMPVRTLVAIVEAMRAAGREAPTSDAGLVAVAAALGLPAGSAAALFAVGRTAGWIAHAFEQRAAGFLLRPRARYVGASAPP